MLLGSIQIAYCHFYFQSPPPQPPQLLQELPQLLPQLLPQEVTPIPLLLLSIYFAIGINEGDKTAAPNKKYVHCQSFSICLAGNISSLYKLGIVVVEICLVSLCKKTTIVMTKRIVAITISRTGLSLKTPVTILVNDSKTSNVKTAKFV